MRVTLKSNNVLLNFLFFFCFVFSCSEIMFASTRSKKPKDSVSYAALILLNEDNQVLLLRRKGTLFGDGLYSLPGGKIESGETALEAVKREVLEEVGVEVADPELVHVVNRQGAQTEFYIFIFKANSWQGIVSNCEQHKCDDVRWVSLDALPENIVSAHQQALKLSQFGRMYSDHGWQ